MLRDAALHKEETHVAASQPAEAPATLRRVLTDRVGHSHKTQSLLQQICLKWCLAGNWGQQERKSLINHHEITELPSVFRKQHRLPSESSDLPSIHDLIFVFRKGSVLFLLKKKHHLKDFLWVSLFCSHLPWETFCFSVKEKLWLLSCPPPETLIQTISRLPPEKEFLRLSSGYN